VVILGEFSFLFVLLYYFVLLGLTISPGYMKQAFRRLLARLSSWSHWGVLTFLTWSARSPCLTGGCTSPFSMAGSANSILIQAPDGGNLLINGGASPATLSDALRQAPLTVRPPAGLADRGIALEEEVAALPQMLDHYPPDTCSGRGT